MASASPCRQCNALCSRCTMGPPAQQNGKRDLVRHVQSNGTLTAQRPCIKDQTSHLALAALAQQHKQGNKQLGQAHVAPAGRQCLLCCARMLPQPATASRQSASACTHKAVAGWFVCTWRPQVKILTVCLTFQPPTTDLSDKASPNSAAGSV